MDRSFSSFLYRGYAIDVIFQQSYKPSECIQEGKVYFIGKHKLYVYKVEMFVLPVGLAINCTAHYARSVSDLEMFQRNKSFHKVATKKVDAEKEKEDFGV